MARKEETGEFRLDVPLDASGIEDFKPEQPVKVLALAGDRPLASQTVKLDAKGYGTARLTLSERPGALRVIVGPHDASDEELAGLQTINVNVSARQWLGKSALQLTPVLIPPYYWHWWFIWCRTFTIRGVVRCPDGSPVPGAKVCAYDVDWFWWWVSKQLINCAITDANGAFEIKFRWCCGWWPWWWWRLRYWQFEPLLANASPDPAARSAPGRAGRDSPQPSLAAFASVLSDEGVLTDPATHRGRPGRALRAARQAAEAAADGGRARAAASLAVVALVSLVGLHARHHLQGDPGVRGQHGHHRR